MAKSRVVFQLTVEYDPALTDADSLASALDTLLESALYRDEYLSVEIEGGFTPLVEYHYDTPPGRQQTGILAAIETAHKTAVKLVEDLRDLTTKATD